jgi:hypothetical protein
LAKGGKLLASAGHDGGVSKWFLDEYVGIFQWAHTLKAVTADFIRALFGLPLTTDLGP